MSNLTEIARKNGGDVYLEQKGSEVYECGVYLSTAQLQATVEQVCKPLVEALLQISCGSCECDSWEYCRNSEPNDTASEAIAAYNLLINHDL